MDNKVHPGPVSQTIAGALQLQCVSANGVDAKAIARRKVERPIIERVRERYPKRCIVEFVIVLLATGRPSP
jgi:hypothetical protein